MPSARTRAQATRVEPRRHYEALAAVPSTLRIPLAARAFGDAMFPHVAVGDAFAAPMMEALDDDGHTWLEDEGCVYGVLVRTRQFRQVAQDFLQAHAGGLVANLGCGLSNYFQWLDDGRSRMIDADLPEVLAIRDHMLPAAEGRHQQRALDLRSPDWWSALDLPNREGAPVCLFTEGVLMYLQPQQVQALLHTFGEQAPAGSLLAFDALCWLTVGNARLHPLVRHTAAEFTWGPSSLAELSRPHPRLRLDAVHQVMEGFSTQHSFAGSAFRFLTGVPYYAVYVLRVEDAPV
ncbi:MAG TPA: class I SAM-dependent methyltransferase [Candidatus Aquabacterium excrementipullorum]|nr:class I SAM-dependent methyltransferase [Candidatus Aquabacterium excrementipullorum]